MQTVSEYGIYKPELTEEIARLGRSYAELRLCQCIEDELYRFALDIHYSFGGQCSPIFASSEGYMTLSAAKDAGIAEIIERIPSRSWNPDEAGAIQELKQLRAQAERRLIQPSLF